MTNRNGFVTFLSPTLPGPIEPVLTLTSPRADRTFRRRRLGLLTGILAATVAVGGLTSLQGDDGVAVVAVASEAGSHGPDGGSTTDDDTIVAEAASTPVTMVELIAQTTSTVLASATTVAETATTEAPATPTTAETTTTATTEPPTPTGDPDPAQATSSASASRAPAPTTAAPTTAPPLTAPTTAPPTTAPPTTAPPLTAPTTAPPAPAAPSSGGSDYGDPNTLQVWFDLAQCEAGGNWSIDTGNGYYGGLQFSLGSWQGVGGSGYPHEHSRDTQIEMGRRLQAQAGWGSWPHCSAKLGLR